MAKTGPAFLLFRSGSEVAMKRAVTSLQTWLADAVDAVNIAGSWQLGTKRLGAGGAWVIKSVKDVLLAAWDGSGSIVGKLRSFVNYGFDQNGPSLVLNTEVTIWDNTFSTNPTALITAKAGTRILICVATDVITQTSDMFVRYRIRNSSGTQIYVTLWRADTGIAPWWQAIVPYTLEADVTDWSPQVTAEALTSMASQGIASNTEVLVFELGTDNYYGS